MAYHQIRDKWFCKECGKAAVNIGVFQNHIWHCYSCEPMEKGKAVDILEWEDEDTLPGVPWSAFDPWGSD